MRIHQSGVTIKNFKSSPSHENLESKEGADLPRCPSEAVRETVIRIASTRVE